MFSATIRIQLEVTDPDVLEIGRDVALEYKLSSEVVAWVSRQQRRTIGDGCFRF